VHQLAPVRILIVDDFQSWRHLVSTMLQERPEFQIIGEASDGLEAVRKTEELRPDLILLDVDLPKLNGVESARRICAIAPGPIILFVSENQSHTVVQEALRSGACTRGYVVKTDAAEELLPALEAVIQGKRFVSGRSVAFKFGDFADA
jgi:DNA-binding NarL/FixJ family response regulator